MNIKRYSSGSWYSKNVIETIDYLKHQGYEIDHIISGHFFFLQDMKKNNETVLFINPHNSDGEMIFTLNHFHKQFN